MDNTLQAPAPGSAAAGGGCDIERITELAGWLGTEGYRFISVTPATHARVLGRPAPAHRSLYDIFGWSRSFRAGELPARILALLREGGALETLDAGLYRSRLRFSTLDGQIFVHSAYPTLADDAVFFGPDTYRFARFIRQSLGQDRRPIRRMVDIGCGSGAGGLVAIRDRSAVAAELVLADLSGAALQCAAISARSNGATPVRLVQSDVLRAVDGDFDLIISNPPYLSDPAGRLYRDGGGRYGAELSLRILRESLPRLRAGGRLLLYTGAACVNGVDVFRQAVEPLLRRSGVRYEYEEIDVDVFGEELELPPYREVERIAAIGLIAYAIEERT